MKIADLFVNIALSGASAVGKGLTGISKGMSEVAEGSLAAKAAVAGVIFGLERLTGFASQAGMDLRKFNLTTGESTDMLQQWQYAFMKVDVSGEETIETMKGVKAAIANMRLGKGAPEAMGFIGIGSKQADNLDYVMGMLEKFAKRKDIAPAIRTQLLSSFNLSGNVIQGMMTMNREADKLSGKQIINPSEIENLVRINSAWKDFWFTLRTMGIKLVAKDGMAAVGELRNAFKFVMDLGGNISKLANDFGILKVAAAAAAVGIALAFAPVTTVITGIMILLGELQKKREGKDNLVDMAGDVMAGKKAKELRASLGLPEPKEVSKSISDMFAGAVNSAKNPGGFFGNAEELARPPSPMTAQQAFADAAKSPAGGGGSPGGGSLKIDVHNYGVVHPTETGDATRRGITDAARQLAIGAGGI